MKYNTFTSYLTLLVVLVLVLPMIVQADVSTAMASSIFQSPIPSETPKPTDEPTATPTNEPTATPTDSPTDVPTATPTDPPTSTPTKQPTSTPTDEVTPDPVKVAELTVDLPDAVDAGQSFNGSIVAQNVSDPGIYGVQLKLLFDPDLVMIDSVTASSGFDYVLRDEADNSSGEIVLIASKTGKVAGLTGNTVTLLTFKATAKNKAGTAMFTFDNEKLSDPQAMPIKVTSKAGSTLIEDNATPAPTDEPTPVPTDEPTPTPTDEPTPTPTDEPTPEPTPTDEPTPVPTDEPTPVPGSAEVNGQVILAGRANNDWSGAEVSAGQDGQPNNATTTTGTTGDFSLSSVPAGSGTIFTADAAGYLSAKCTGATVATPQTELEPVTLLSGDITNDDKIDIEDATAVGVSFDQTGSGMAADINQDEVIDIFDLVLVSINFNAEGPQDWDCQ